MQQFDVQAVMAARIQRESVPQPPSAPALPEPSAPATAPPAPPAPQAPTAPAQPPLQGERRTASSSMRTRTLSQNLWRASHRRSRMCAYGAANRNAGSAKDLAPAS